MIRFSLWNLVLHLRAKIYNFNRNFKILCPPYDNCYKGPELDRKLVLPLPAAAEKALFPLAVVLVKGITVFWLIFLCQIVTHPN